MAFEAIISFSDLPLRIAVALGFGWDFAFCRGKCFVVDDSGDSKTGNCLPSADCPCVFVFLAGFAFGLR